MTNASESVAPRGSLFWRLYAVAWTLMGVAAIGYLSVALAQPDLLASPKDKAASAVDTALLQQKRVTRELATLRESVSSLRHEVDRIKDDVASQVAQAKPIAEPEPPPTQPDIPPVVPLDVTTKAVPTTIERPAVEQPAQVAAQPTPAQRSSRTPPLPVRVPVARRQVANNELPSSIVTATILNAPETTNITTGSVPAAAPSLPETVERALDNTRQTARVPTAVVPPAAAPAIKFGAATVQPSQPSGPTSVVVSVAPSIDVLRFDWQRLAAQHPALLGTLYPRYDVMAADGPYRLLAGPLSDREEAERLCAALRAYSVTCGVEDGFVGNAL